MIYPELYCMECATEEMEAPPCSTPGCDGPAVWCSPGEAAARSEPRYTRAEALTMAAEMLEEFRRPRATYFGAPDALYWTEAVRYLRARAEERSHEG